MPIRRYFTVSKGFKLCLILGKADLPKLLQGSSMADSRLLVFHLFLSFFLQLVPSRMLEKCVTVTFVIQSSQEHRFHSSDFCEFLSFCAILSLGSTNLRPPIVYVKWSSLLCLTSSKLLQSTHLSFDFLCNMGLISPTLRKIFDHFT